MLGVLPAAGASAIRGGLREAAALAGLLGGATLALALHDALRGPLRSLAGCDALPGDLLAFAVVFLPARIGAAVVAERLLRRPRGRWLSACDACAGACLGALRALLWAALLFLAFSWATLGAVRPAVWQEAQVRPLVHAAAAFLVRQLPDDLLPPRPAPEADPWRR